jgi:hypothetical protein
VGPVEGVKSGGGERGFRGNVKKKMRLFQPSDGVRKKSRRGKERKMKKEEKKRNLSRAG